MVDIQHVLRQNVIKTTVCKTSLFQLVLALFNGYLISLAFSRIHAGVILEFQTSYL